MRGLTVAAILAALVAAGGASATETVTGRARVIDGNTLEIAGERIRLEGIDAPESIQLCRGLSGNPYRCGVRAIEALRARIGPSARSSPSATATVVFWARATRWAARTSTSGSC